MRGGKLQKTPLNGVRPRGDHGRDDHGSQKGGNEVQKKTDEKQ